MESWVMVVSFLSGIYHILALSISKLALLFFECVPNPGKESLTTVASLRKFRDVSCNSDEHQQMFFIAVLHVCIFIMAPVALMAWNLWRLPAATIRNPQVAQRFESLF